MGILKLLPYPMCTLPCSLLATVWVAVVLKGSDSSNVWLNRLIKGLQLFAMVIYTVFWPAILDYFTFMWDCKWSLIPQGSPAVHTFFQENSEWHVQLLCM